MEDSGILAQTVLTLRAAGCVFAEEEAALLVSQADSAQELSAMVARRCAGHPLEHVLGWAEFCGLRVLVDPGVFVPRRRSEFLVSVAAELCRPGARVMDLCCGTGALGLALSHRVAGVDLYAADLDPAAVACAQRNLGLAPVYGGDLFGEVPAGLRFDLVLANVPYVPTSEVEFMPAEARLHEARMALDGGAEGVDLQRRATGESLARLRPGGCLLVETSERQEPLTVRAFEEAGLEVSVHRDEELDATVVVGARGGAVASVRQGQFLG
ncbi:putative protein N(5)-glutamine methyltransferase [Psychromicrobium xiongbiense]|uniref:putative protein N(5)-glutamine methyltransferase n=1 Tax=Psychromicrobium xiongbiense TaxID=3051184 RepID=UPI002556771F|nr:putative protein N(5)-glutamine methyltransferase [Psychromicrobium sp. YIM S02556]